MEGFPPVREEGFPPVREGSGNGDLDGLAD